jgi:hypothetical protein
MEELQDAIENAQYMHAMHNQAPQPTADWVWPTPEQLEQYMASVTDKDPSLTEIEGFCKQPLGFHLVSVQLYIVVCSAFMRR